MDSLYSILNTIWKHVQYWDKNDWNKGLNLFLLIANLLYQFLKFHHLPAFWKSVLGSSSQPFLAHGTPNPIFLHLTKKCLNIILYTVYYREKRRKNSLSFNILQSYGALGGIPWPLLCPVTAIENHWFKGWCVFADLI